LPFSSIGKTAEMEVTSMFSFFIKHKKSYRSIS
jgi:hypothetical protein